LTIERSEQPQQQLLTAPTSPAVTTTENKVTSPVKSSTASKPSPASTARRSLSSRTAPRVIPILGWDGQNATKQADNNAAASAAPSISLASSPSASTSTTPSPSAADSSTLTVPSIQTSNLTEPASTASSSSSPVIIEDVPTTPDEDAKEDAVLFEKRVHH